MQRRRLQPTSMRKDLHQVEKMWPADTATRSWRGKTMVYWSSHVRVRFPPQAVDRIQCQPSRLAFTSPKSRIPLKSKRYACHSCILLQLVYSHFDRQANLVLLLLLGHLIDQTLALQRRSNVFQGLDFHLFHHDRRDVSVSSLSNYARFGMRERLTFFWVPLASVPMWGRRVMFCILTRRSSISGSLGKTSNPAEKS